MTRPRDDASDRSGSSGAKPARRALPPSSVDRHDLAKRDPGGFARAVSALPEPRAAAAVCELPPELRAAVIAAADKPMRLARTLPDVEFYLTLREIGPIDALPLIALGSAEQLEHVLDLESWRDDRFDAERAGAWLAVLAEAGDPTLRRVVRAIEDDALVLLFRSWARVHAIEFDDQIPTQGPGESESGDERGFVSPDGYHRFSPVRVEHAQAVRKTAEMLFRDDPQRYLTIVWEAIQGLPSENEENAFMRRSSRLEEHGFPPFEEALTVYAPPAHSASKDRIARPGPIGDDGRPAPRLPMRAAHPGGPLDRAIAELTEDDRELFLEQAVAVANRILVADRLDTGSPEAHRAAVRKLTGALDIALARRGPAGPAGELVRSVPVIELFREGHREIAALAARTAAWVRNGWPGGEARRLGVLDPPLGSRIEALLDPRPTYVEVGPEGDGVLREFRSVGELEETRGAVDVAETVGDVLVLRLGLDLDRLEAWAAGRTHEPTFSTVLLTLCAWHAVRDELRIDPLPPDVVDPFIRDCVSRRTAAPDAASRAMGRSVEALARRLELRPRDVGVLEGFARASVTRLTEECSRLVPGTPLDARAIGSLLLEIELHEG